MKIVVVTSCTGEKAAVSDRALTLDDFRRGSSHVTRREGELGSQLLPAEAMYTGQQHLRLMVGVKAFREAATSRGVGDGLELWILSAGYGLVPSARRIAPYEATFQGMRKAELDRHADLLGVPSAIRSALATPYDLGLVLLGDGYLAASRLDATVRLGGPTLILCGSAASSRLPRIPEARPIPLTNREAKRFGCGLVALKGDLGARILRRISTDPGFARNVLLQADVLSALDEGEGRTRPARGRAQPKPDVDQVITLPPSWRDKPHRAKLRYFIPEWDDLVDRDYDFENDVHSGDTGDWSNEVYAHQLYPEPNYDGILVSKVVAEKSRKKKERINRLGVHRFLRVPREFPVMGDCGAFGYIHEKVPPYTTDEILDYYTRLDFDFGVSIDHLIVTATESEKKARYDLTVENAAEFLKAHRKAGLPWTPIGAVQGWDPKSYAAAAKKYVAMGYRYIALGGLVRTSTPEILDVLEEVHSVVPPAVGIHLFGLARIASMRRFADLGVRSVDSASLLRRAWMGTGQNYLAMDGKFYTAIRVPEAGKSFRAKRMVSEGRASARQVERLEGRCLEALSEYDASRLSIDEALETIEAYDRLITPERPPTRDLLRETLAARPWRACPCRICQRDGIHVVIFRGNNRNRRRGFHNTYVFYRLLQRALAGEHVTFTRGGGDGVTGQLPLFDSQDDVAEAADAL